MDKNKHRTALDEGRSVLHAQYGRKDDSGADAQTKEADAKFAAAVKAAVGPLENKLSAVQGLVDGFEKKLDESGNKFREEVDEKLTELKDAHTHLEQLLAREPEQKSNQILTAGQQFIKNADMSAIYDQKRGSAIQSQKVSYELEDDRGFVIQPVTGQKAITSLTASAGPLLEPDIQPGLVPLRRRRLTIRQICPVTTTSDRTVKYHRKKSVTNNAAIVAETNLKPESSMDFDEKLAEVVTIAHFFTASVQILDDLPRLQTEIDFELRYGLDDVEEQNFLSGAGGAGQIEGFLTAATAYAPPAGITVATETRLDRMALAYAVASLDNYVPTAFVLNPIDWTACRLAKDANGNYLLGGPYANDGMAPWGVGLVESQAMTIGEWLTGDFQRGCMIHDRNATRIDVSTEDSDNFRKNMVTIRGEKDTTLAIKTDTFMTGDFTGL